MNHFRTAYPNELYHHGIKGQKWGVRRFQNKDGSLTKAGKDRYKATKHAEGLYYKAKLVEPKITKDVRSVISGTTAKMYGLAHRLKTKESLQRKIETDALNDNMSLNDSASKIKDAVRYTAMSEDKDFTKNYFQIKNNLENKGYSEVRCKNYFDLYNKGAVKHKSVQSVFKDPNGYLFELQFQTKASQNAKNKKVPLYEEARKPNISRERLKKLETEMVKLAENVPTPPNVYKIKTHG
jgi:hypothetical protein